MIANIVNSVCHAFLIGHWGIAENVVYPCHNIVDIGKIPQHVPIVINLNGLSVHNFLCKFIICHIRPAKGPIYRKKSQTCHRIPVQFTIGMGHQFIGLFGGGIQTDGTVNLILYRVGRFFIAPIHRAGRCEYQMLNAKPSACFQDMEKTNQVGRYIGIRIVNAVPNAGLCAQIHGYLRLIRLKHMKYRLFIRQISFHKYIIGKFLQDVQPGFL